MGARNQQRNCVCADAVKDGVVKLVDAAVTQDQVETHRQERGHKDKRENIDVEFGREEWHDQ